MLLQVCRRRHADTMSWTLLIAVVLHHFITSVDGIQLLQVSVPSVIQAGEEAVLLCDVDLEGDVLYSVKWYKDNDYGSEEFFRYVPRDSPQFLIYNVDGIIINRTESDSKRVHLSSVTLASSGHYRCEVSAEAPSFSSVSGGGFMEVVVLPRQRPIITGGRSNYRPGDLVDVNCTSAASKPAANIRWFINDKKVPANSINVRKYKAVWGEDGLETTVLGLTFVVQENHLSSQGKLTLRCVSSVGPASASVVPPPQTQTQPEQPALQHVNDPPAASTASLAGYDQNYEPHLLSPVMESMEVRFEASKASCTSSMWWMSLLVCICVAMGAINS